MKKTLIAAACILSAQASFADDFFIGIDVGKSYMKVDGDRSNDLTKNSNLSPGIRAGLINEDYRIYGSLIGHSTSYKDQGSKTDEEIVYGQMTANVDFFLPVHKQVKLFAGPHLGIASASVTVDYDKSYNDSDSDSDSASGVVYGGQFGAIFDVNKNVSIETGYSHSFTSIDGDLEYKADGKDVKTDIDIDQVGRVYFAASYTF